MTKFSFYFFWLLFSLTTLLATSKLDANNELSQIIKKTGPHGGKVQEFGSSHDIECYRNVKQAHFFVLIKDSVVGDSIKSHQGGTLTVSIQGNDILEMKSIPKKIPFQEISIDLPGVDRKIDSKDRSRLHESDHPNPNSPRPHKDIVNVDIDKKDSHSKTSSNNRIEAVLRLSVPSLKNRVQSEHEILIATCEF